MFLTGWLFCREYHMQGLTLQTFHCVMPIALRPSSTWMSMKWVSGCLVWLERICRGFTGRLDLQLCSYLRALRLGPASAGWVGRKLISSQICSFSWFIFSFSWFILPITGDHVGHIGWQESWHMARGHGLYPVGQQFSESRSAMRYVANNTLGSKCLQTIYLFVCFLISGACSRLSLQ